MMIKNTRKIVLLTMLTLGFILNSKAQNNSGNVRGNVFDGQGKGVSGAVVLLYVEDDTTHFFDKKITSANGEFSFSDVTPGRYIIKVDKFNHQGFKSEVFDVQANNTEYFTEDKKITIYNKAYEFGKIDIKGAGSKKSTGLTDTKTSFTIGQKDLIKTGARGFNALAGLGSGITVTPSGLSGRGGRPDGTAYFIDGVRVFNANLTQGFSGSVEVLQAGIPAQYGDFTGLGVSLTTRGGVSSRVSKSFEIQSSSMFNPYHHNLIEGFMAFPILFKTNPNYVEGGSENVVKKYAIAAMSIGANFSYQREPAPSYIGYYQIKDEKLAELEQTPLAANKDGGFVSSANFLTENDFDKVKVRDNARAYSSSAQAKFDFRISDLATLSVFGNFNYSNATNTGNNASMLIYKTNPLRTSTSVLGYVKYTQKFKDPDSTRKANNSTLNNAYFTVRFDYQSSWTTTQDQNFRENVFDYGYIGQFKHYPTEFYSYYGSLNNPNAASRRFVDQNGDTVYLRNFWEQTGFRDTAIRFTGSSENKVRANYTQNVFDKISEQGAILTSDAQILQLQGLLNGYNPNPIYSLFNTPGFQQAGYNKTQSERYTLYAMGEAELMGPVKANKKSSAHALQFGLTFEQTINRGYGLGANDLWRLMYQLANSHIAELDKTKPILSYDANGVFQDTVKYNRLVNADKQTHFDKEFRNKLISEGATDVYGKAINERTFLDINSYKPGDFSMDMFSADELLNNGSSYVSYYGYDHLGNKLKGRPGINDFLQDKTKRSIGAFMPIYTAAWFQDKFYLDDLEFRLGLRLERYDANQLVLKDQYSLYPVRTAGEVSEIDGNSVTHPTNIGEDYAVYVNDVKNPTKILGYRKDNTWYDASGNQLSTPDLIANKTNNGRIAPYLVNPNQNEITENSFQDYKPKVNILPRVFFKFPLNKTSLFYASYDVLAQRPTPGANFLTIDDYYYMTQKASNTLANPALTSRITTDYQIGYKQQVSKSTLLSVISYYRETKNDLSVYQFNQAYPVTYISYNNIDFSTVKGFITELTYNNDKYNISLNGNYTLQFADGTGSNINSQRALIASNQPNLRSLFPLGELDIRHQIKGIFNWEFPDDDKKRKIKYMGPIIGGKKILKNTNFNITYAATSGLPYTATSQPVQSGSVDRAQIKGTPYGSRLPWQFTTSMNISKDIQLKWEGSNGKKKTGFVQVYFYVTNLFNTRNVNGVYPYTGSPADDGFLNSQKGQQALTSQLSAEAYNYYYRTAINSPGNYQAPRFMRLGAKFNF
ncbi:MAG: carboxypeptidase regulatory-like domain-containing protein [Bacteroidota bacterium]